MTPAVTRASDFLSSLKPSVNDTQFARAAKIAGPILGAYFVESYVPYGRAVFFAVTAGVAITHAQAPEVTKKEKIAESVKAMVHSAIQYVSTRKMIDPAAVLAYLQAVSQTEASTPAASGSTGAGVSTQANESGALMMLAADLNKDK